MGRALLLFLALGLPVVTLGQGPGQVNPLEELTDVGHNHSLVGLGLLLALTAFLALAALATVGLAALAGAPVPMLAALPSSSAALLSVQLLARVAHEQDASPSVVDLGRCLSWAAPPGPHWELGLSAAVICGTYASRKLVAGRHKSGPLPHSLTPGAWELRVLGLLALPLSASACRLLLTDGLLGILLGLPVLLGIAHSALSSLKVVGEALEESKVVRVRLPETTGGEVFADRNCDQLLALPVQQQPPGCPALFGTWPSSPSWCVAPLVAAVKEVEQRGPRASDAEHDSCAQWAGTSSWCSVDDTNQAKGQNVELEDELQGRPLLPRGGQPQEDVEVIEAGMEDESPRNGSSSTEGGGSPSKAVEDAALPGPPARPAARRRSLVASAHPVRVTLLAPYEARSGGLVAGVACLRWLDCAVPASALPRLEELGGDLELSCHPGQLCGPLTAGRFAACFDWGTRWPLRWTLDLVLRACLGLWAAAPLRGGPAPGILSGVGHLLMLVLATACTYGLVTAGPYEHKNDDAAAVLSGLASVFLVLLRALGEGASALAYLLAAGAGLLALAPCALALLAAVGLASAAVGQLEAAGLQDRCLPRTVAGWGQQGRCRMEGRGVTGSIGGCGPLPDVTDAVALEGHAVEAVLPGQRKAFSIVLPAVSQLRVMHVQLLPPVANRNGDPECQPPCMVTGDRARLPLPAALLFPGIVQPGTAVLSSGVDLAELNRRRQQPPLLALLAPGHAGRLVYEEEEHNEQGLEWRRSLEDFFGFDGSLLAEEAEKLVEQHALDEEGGDGGPRNVLVVVEVLPAWAAEFVDERERRPEGP